MRTDRLLPLAAAILAVAFVSPLAAQSASVEGRVITADGAPVAGAVVRASGPAASDHSAVADVGGHFSLSGLPGGTIRLTATGAGYGTTAQTIELTAGIATRVTLTLAVAAVRLEGVNVVSLRTSVPISTVPGAVTVVGREAMEMQGQLTRNLGDMLAQVVPGLGAGMQTPSVYGQSLRGRGAAVLIDGVPQSTTRNVSRDLATIDPAVIERVEVLRGATSIYGDGATGGVINIITRAPAAGRAQLTTTIAGESSAKHFEDGLGGRLTQTVEGRSGALVYLFSGTFGRTGDYFDAEGDRIPADPHGQGGLAETTSRDLFAKIGATFGERRIQFSLNRFATDQSTGHFSDPSVKAQPAGEVKARSLAGLQLADDQGTRNTVASLDYRDTDLLGSQLHAQLYHRDYHTVFTPFDGRSLAAYQSVIQSWLESRKTGGRFELETSLPAPGDPVLVWGADYTRESTAQPVHVFDADIYDQSGGLVFSEIGRRPWVPEIQPRSLGAFAQLSLRPFERLTLRAGVRHERARMQVPDFTTLIGNAVTGGELRFEPTLLNAGAVVQLTGALATYASYSQGFSLADVGLALRSASAGAVLGNQEMKAQEVDQYEAGVRGAWRALDASLAAFRTTSELGTTSAGFGQPVVRAPERVHGVEATLDVQAIFGVSTGGTFGWTEGEYFREADDTWYALNSWRIQPLKATLYAEHEARNGWSNRLQLLYSGTRDRSFEDRPNPSVVGFGERPVRSYWVADWISAFGLGPGTLNIGVQNLLNRQYFSVGSQLLRSGDNTSYTAAHGRTLSLGYTVAY
jgi:iron complex outermembrane receptor protein